MTWQQLRAQTRANAGKKQYYFATLSNGRNVAMLPDGRLYKSADEQARAIAKQFRVRVYSTWMTYTPELVGAQARAAR